MSASGTPEPLNEPPSVTPPALDASAPDVTETQRLVEQLAQSTLQHEKMQRETQQLLLQVLSSSSKSKKIWIDKPDKFDGKVGDYINSWLDTFDKFFEYRERSENKEVDHEERIAIAVNNTTRPLNEELIGHERTFGTWDTWDEFKNYMRERFETQESGFECFLRLRHL